MIVADERWGAELITVTGVIRTYDSVECLARDVIEEVVPAQDVASLWVVPWDAPGTLVPAQDAIYRRASAMRGPMGDGIAAFRRESGAPDHWTQSGDSILNWDAVLVLVSAAPEIPRHAHESDRAR
jgi:copper chaperone NosL